MTTEIMNLLKSDNIEDEILGWRIAYHQGIINEELADEIVRWKGSHTRDLEFGIILRFDNFSLRIGDLYGVYITNNDEYKNYLHWKSYDFRENT